MKTDTIKILSTAIMLSLLLPIAGCTAPIDIETGRMEPELFVYGAMRGESNRHHFFQIGTTKDYFDTPENEGYINDAFVQLLDSSGKIYQLTNSGGYGWYRNYVVDGQNATIEPIAIEPGEFRMEIYVDEQTHPVGGHYLISETVKPSVKLDSVKMVPTQIKIFGALRRVYVLEFYFQDPPEENLYMFTIQIDNPDGTEKYAESEAISTLTLFDDSAFNGQYLDGLTLINASYEPSINDNGDGDGTIYLNEGDVVTIRLANLSEGYYRFIDECQRATVATNPFFGGPPANIYSNIPGGRGYFTAYIQSEATTIVPPLREEQAYNYKNINTDRIPENGKQ